MNNRITVILESENGSKREVSLSRVPVIGDHIYIGCLRLLVTGVELSISNMYLDVVRVGGHYDIDKL